MVCGLSCRHNRDHHAATGAGVEVIVVGVVTTTTTFLGSWCGCHGRGQSKQVWSGCRGRSLNDGDWW